MIYRLEHLLAKGRQKRGHRF